MSEGTFSHAVAHIHVKNMDLGEIINTDFPHATMADIDVLPPTGIGVRYRKIVTLSDDVSFVLVYR